MVTNVYFQINHISNIAWCFLLSNRIFCFNLMLETAILEDHEMTALSSNGSTIELNLVERIKMVNFYFYF